MSRIDIFSHVKNEWVFNSVVNTDDIANLFDDLMIRPKTAVIHTSLLHPFHSVATQLKFVIKPFNGLTGKYKTPDDSVYHLFYKKSPKPPRINRDLIASCIQAKVKSTNQFIVDPANIERNIRHQLWVKIEE